MTIHDNVMQDLQDLLNTDRSIVELKLYNSFFNKQFIEKCVEEIKFLPTRISMGVPLTSLEILALTILKDTAE